MLSPSFEDFVRLAGTADLVPVWREVLFDTDTAVTAYAKLARARPGAAATGAGSVTGTAAARGAGHASSTDSAAPARFGFLLESVEGGEKWARYTFLGTAPREAWKLEHGGRISRWTAEAGWSEPEPTDDPLAALERRLRERTAAEVPDLPRFTGGAVGYLGYDVVRYIERLPDAPPDPLGHPEAILLFTDLVLAIDNLLGRARAIAMVDVSGADGEAALRARYAGAAEKIDAMVRTLAEAPAPSPLPLSTALRSPSPLSRSRETGPEAGRGGGGDPEQLDGGEGAGSTGARDTPPWKSEYARNAFERDVARIKEYIRNGDAFQVVLSRRLTAAYPADSFHLYRLLRSLNPSPYLYFLELDGISLVGSSPEVLVRVEDGRAIVRPIAGTRPRGRTDAEDDALAAELLSDEKERAEHLMLVDLGRNDVGRIAEYGTVTVPEFMSIERYSHVLHLVSRVEAKLADGVAAMDVFRACFPAGTVSGAPKVRAMEIIDELEPERRGPYAGAVGYFNYGGDALDTAIAIRTLVAAEGKAHVQAGAGIVADSVPDREYEETLAKAGALLRVVSAIREMDKGAI